MINLERFGESCREYQDFTHEIVLQPGQTQIIQCIGKTKIRVVKAQSGKVTCTVSFISSDDFLQP